jgi:hypothetical protein
MSAELPGIDVEPLCAGGFNLMIGRRDDGSWHVSRSNRKTSARRRAIAADGATLEEALASLGQQIFKPTDRDATR